MREEKEEMRDGRSNRRDIRVSHAPVATVARFGRVVSNLSERGIDFVASAEGVASTVERARTW